MIFHNNDCSTLSNEAQRDVAFVQFMCDALGGWGMAGSTYIWPRKQ